MGRRYDQFRQLSDSSSSRGSLTTKILGNIHTIIPPVALARTFEGAVVPIVAKIVLLRRQTAALTSTRDALIPSLISGQMRIMERSDTDAYN
jgi:type I restriction enzyme S subunit